MPDSLVPEGFVVPPPLLTDDFRFEPLAEYHNDLDHLAWTSSIPHIQATPGFADWGWPTRVMTLEENRRDLARHHDDYLNRKGFTYAVFDRAEDYVGCVYLYPSRTSEHDVEVRSWVRADLADRDKPLFDAVTNWLIAAWPWRHPNYAPR